MQLGAVFGVIWGGVVRGNMATLELRGEVSRHNTKSFSF